MTSKQFAKETTRIIKENKKVLVEFYKSNAETKYGALMLYFTDNEMKYYYVSESYNNELYKKLKPFMVEKIQKNPEKIYVVCIGPKDLVATYLLVDDFHVINN